jgi:hypothetical protein
MASCPGCFKPRILGWKEVMDMPRVWIERHEPSADAAKRWFTRTPRD